MINLKRWARENGPAVVLLLLFPGLFVAGKLLDWARAWLTRAGWVNPVSGRLQRRRSRA